MSLGNLLPPWHQFLDQKIRGAHFSLRIVAGERFAIELTPSTFPQRHFAGDRFPQRHVAGERVGMLLGKASNVVIDQGTLVVAEISLDTTPYNCRQLPSGCLSERITEDESKSKEELEQQASPYEELEPDIRQAILLDAEARDIIT
ncbi:hypothetical protein Tco_0951273 [Tanacetum coccineum]|uniref:Uncharacterized protein n=1 Tax=Tanacetum coccineum TaxID=301880 RepID=A0ABQ5DVD5_9ASTR